MKIVIVSTFESKGGAAIAAKRLYTGLNMIGHDTKMVVRFKQSEDPNIINSESSYSHNHPFRKTCKRIQEEYINKNRTGLSNTFFSFPYPGNNITSLPCIQEADVINIHWIALFLAPENVHQLLLLGKPVVWTLHDQTPFTGGCHYTAGCREFVSGCEVCPQLSDDPFKLTSYVLNLKNKLFGFRNLSFVSPSLWLKNEAEKSLIGKNHKIFSIANGIDVSLYSPIEKTEAKKKLNIDEDIFTLYFGAFNSEEKRKGFDYLESVMQKCMENEYFKRLVLDKKILILTSGNTNPEIESIPIQKKYLGYLDNDRDLMLAYNASDLLLLPSREDNLPNLMVEAMACGTPVISFNMGGMPDLIKHMDTGFLAKPFDLDEYASYVISALNNPNQILIMGNKCRNAVKEKCEIREQSKKYADLFNTLFKDVKSSEVALDEPVYSNENQKYMKELGPLFEKFS